MVSDVLSTALSVPLALLLYQLFKPVHKMQAVWMALLLVAAMPISFVVALNYVAAQWLLTGAPEFADLTPLVAQAVAGSGIKAGQVSMRPGYSLSEILLCWSPEDKGRFSARASRHHTAGSSCRAR